MAESATDRLTGRGYTPRMRKHYDDVVRPKLDRGVRLQERDGGAEIEKIVLNMGVGESTADSKKATVAAADLAQIAGQKPVATKARTSISPFKLREGMTIGCKVTLRKTGCTSSWTAWSPSRCRA